MFKVQIEMGKAKQVSKVENAISMIKERYAIGKAILKQCGPTSPPGLITELAKQHGINRDTAQKLRAMASKDSGYTQRELNKWFRLFKKDDHALSISHFIKLVSVPKGKERDRLTEEALTNRWSSHRLQKEILALQGRRQEGGRRPTVVIGDEFEGELEQTMWAWNRWLELHVDANTEVRPEILRELNAIKKKVAKVNGLLVNRLSRRESAVL